MAYEFQRAETVDEAAARIVREQLTAALAWLDVAAGSDANPGPDADLEPTVAAHVSDEVDGEAAVPEAVHEARKCCKRVRGLVRLVRPAMEDAYDATNAATRDAAGVLSSIRDAHALLATFDDLVATHVDQVPDGGVPQVRWWLADRAEAATAAVTASRERIETARELLVAARDGIADWPLRDLGADERIEAIAAGIGKTAGRARARFDDVVGVPGPPPDELLHQWRKRVKYSWYHVSLLEPAAPSLLGPHADLLHDLSDVLGDDHDLAVLADQLDDAREDLGAADEVAGTRVLLDGTRADLRRRAVGVGARLHAEDPEAMGERMVALLQAWWTHGPEPRAGEIDDLHDEVDDLGDMTNGQLRELAREQDLPGRSRMDRAGLLGALRATGPTPRP